VIEKIIGENLPNAKGFDVEFIQTSSKFLPFRKILPFRVEALAMVTALV